MSGTELARRLEVTLANPAATHVEIEKLSAEAIQQGLYGVGVSSSRTALARSLLEDSSVKVIGLISVPWGDADSDVKRFETETAIDLGAQEIELMLNVGRLKDGDHQYIIRELRDVVEAADERPVVLVLETSLLTQDEARFACELALDSGVQGISTGAGKLATGTPEDVKGLRTIVGTKFLVKAAGNVPGRAAALALIEAGADRIGVSSSPRLILGSGPQPGQSL